MNVKQEQYEQAYFPGLSIDYNIVWLCSDLQNIQQTDGRIQIHTRYSGACSGRLLPEEVGSWASHVGHAELPKVPCVAKLTWSLCEASFSCVYNPSNDLLDGFQLEHMNGFMKTPQGRPWEITFIPSEFNGDKTALMLELDKGSLAFGRDLHYLFAVRIVKGPYQKIVQEAQVPLKKEISAHEEDNACQVGSVEDQVAVTRSRSASNDSSVEEDEDAIKATNEKRSPLEEGEGPSTIQLTPSRLESSASSQTEESKSMQSMCGIMGWRWVNWRPKVLREQRFGRNRGTA